MYYSPDVALRYALNGWTQYSGLVTKDRALAYAAALTNANSRRVNVNESKANWTEYEIKKDTPLYDALTSEKVLYFVRHITNKNFIRHIGTWGNSYEVGEYIPEHKDDGGSVQMLLVLVSPPPNCGGVLTIDSHAIEDISPGDAVFFAANKLLHGTTPLIKSIKSSEPQRIVAVARFYME
jgi:hypothetical protein